MAAESLGPAHDVHISTAQYIALTASVLQRGATEEEQAKYSKRSVRVTRQQNEDCKRLLRLLGVPIIDVRLSDGIACALVHRCSCAIACHSVLSLLQCQSEGKLAVRLC